MLFGRFFGREQQGHGAMPEFKAGTEVSLDMVQVSKKLVEAEGLDVDNTYKKQNLVDALHILQVKVQNGAVVRAEELAAVNQQLEELGLEKLSN